MAIPPLSEELAKEAIDAVEKYGSIVAAAKAIGMSRETLRDRYRVAMKRKARLTDVPMSEDAGRFMADWGPDECIAELRRIAKIDPDMVVSRNYFRVHAVCSESTWNRYFGTFEEFKRQAGLKLTRQQHNLEKQIAKHASVDHYRAMNMERAAYADKYKRENKRRFKVVLRASDLHDIECDPFFLRVFLETARRVQPEVICLCGDIFDLPEFGKYPVDPRQWDVVGRIRHVHDEILQPLREACPESQIDIIEGNHEFRLMRHIADATPALRAVLADLHGMTVAKLLGLDYFEVNYVAKADLAAYTLRNIQEEVANNYRVYFGALLAHHFPDGKRFGMPGFNGHHHSWEVARCFSQERGAYQWVHAGCGHIRDATYTNGQKWQMEFGLCHVDTETKSVLHECIPVNDWAIVGGRYYSRRQDEWRNGQGE